MDNRPNRSTRKCFLCYRMPSLGKYFTIRSQFWYFPALPYVFYYFFIVDKFMVFFYHWVAWLPLLFFSKCGTSARVHEYDVWAVPRWQNKNLFTWPPRQHGTAQKSNGWTHHTLVHSLTSSDRKLGCFPDLAVWKMWAVILVNTARNYRFTSCY